MQDTLFDLGIGERNYFIFEQGSVEKMVNLKPSERRILIEEAAGIAQYLERKKETAGKLIIAQQNLDSLELVLQEKNNRLRDLKNQVHFARRYRDIKNSRNDLLKALLKKKYVVFKEEFDQQGNRIMELINGETALVREIGDFDKQLLELENRRWALEQGIKNNQQFIFDHNNKLLDGSKEIEKTQQRQEFDRQKIAELDRLSSESEAEIREGEGQDKALASELAAFEQELAGRSEGDGELASALEEIRQAIAGRNIEEGHRKKAMFDLQVEISRNRNEAAHLEKNLSRLEGDIASRRHLVDDLEKQGQDPELVQVEVAVQGLAEALAAREGEFVRATAGFAAAREAGEALEKQLRDAQAEIANLERQKEKYLEIKAKITGSVPAAVEGGSGFLQEQLRAAKDLHAVLESFYYDELDAPILADPAAALRPELRKAFLKRAAAPALPDAIRREPGFRRFVKELFELEDGDLKQNFRDGVLVDSLKNGLAIFARYGVDVVTENAEVIGAGGVLIKNRDRGILEVLDEIKAIDGRVSALNGSLAGIRAGLEAAAVQKQAKAVQLQGAERALNSQKEEGITLRSRLEGMRKNRDLGQKRIQLTGAEIDGFTAEMEKLKGRLAELEKSLQALDERNGKLEREKEEAAGESGKLQRQLNEKEKEKLQRDNALSLIREKMSSRRNLLRESKTRLEKRRQQIQSAAEEKRRLEQEIADSAGKIGEIQARAKVLNLEKTELEKLMKKDEQALAEVSSRAKKVAAELAAKRKVLEEWRENKKESEIKIAAVKKDLFQLEEVAGQELGMELKDIEAGEEALQRDAAELDAQYGELVAKLNRMRESDRLNFSAEAEYEILEKDFNFLSGQKEDIVQSIADMNAAIARIDTDSKQSFLSAFTAIKENFVKNFEGSWFEGGEAELALTDSENVLEAGLEIQVQPPGKRLQSIRLLSGGEKTLTSLAFLFSLFEYKPSPFCVFDEVDASLDEANIQRFLKFLHQLKSQTQFVIITHNFKTMEEADFIYGISMDEPGVSKMYSMKMT